MEPLRDDLWLERLASKLAASFIPFFGEPKRDEWRRSLCDFLGVADLPAPEVLEWGPLDCDSAMRALSRWLNLDGAAASSEITSRVGCTVGYRDRVVPAAFRRLETRPGERESCLSSGTAFLARGEDRWVIVVEYDARPPVEVQVSVYADPERPVQRDAFLAEIEAAMSAHRIGRGELLVYHQNGPRLMPRPAVSWDDVVLPCEILTEIHRNVVVPLAAFTSPCGAEARIPRRRSLLLSGPPGTGKTQIGKALAASLRDVSFLWVTPGGLEHCNDVAALFEWARQRTPAIVFFEDLDLVVRERGEGRDSMLGEILAQLDGFAANDGIVVVATTNDATVFDAALKRPGRFDRHLVIATPGEEERRRLLERIIAAGEVEPRELVIAELVEATRGLAGAHLQELLQAARLACAARGETVLDQRDLRTALDAVRDHRRGIGFGM